MEGETLELIVTIDFNLVLENITWNHNNSDLVNGSDRVTIINSGFDPPTATSTLTRTNISRITDSGSYVATVRNRAGTSATTFTVDVACKELKNLLHLYAYTSLMCFLAVPPEVSVTATQTRIAEGQSTTLTCSIITSNPSDPNITWSFINTSGVTTILSGKTGQTLQLSDIAEDEIGTYTCNATNSEGLSGTGDITIEQGCKPTLMASVLHTCTYFYSIMSVVIPQVNISAIDPVVPGDNVTLNCSATGSTPLTYQWTVEGSDTTINTDTSTGILTLTNFMESQFGTYICNVSNVLGNEVNSITVEQASKLL